MFNGEIPTALTFGGDLWCEPVISLHHLSGEAMQDLWQWMEEWKHRTTSMQPFLFRDLFQYVVPHIVSNREDWDNMHESMKIFPKHKASHTSFENCKAACEMDSSCFQFVYDGTTCALSDHIRLGNKRLPEENRAQTYRSGWMVGRIRDWAMKTHCASAHWLHSNP